MNGKLFTLEHGTTSVATSNHPCVFRVKEALAAQGVLPGGMLTAEDATGKVIPYDRAGIAPTNVLKGVLSRAIDTASDDAAITIIHGTVVSGLLVHGAAAGAVTQADLIALEAINIYPE